MKTYFLFILCLSLFSACSNQSDNEGKEISPSDTGKTTEKEGWIRSYYPGGIVKKTEVYYKKGIRDGMARSFYKDGSICVEGMYKNGMREGHHKWFYEDTKTLYEDIPFIHDRKEGIKKKYFKNGWPNQTTRALPLSSATNASVIIFLALKLRLLFINSILPFIVTISPSFKSFIFFIVRKSS